MKSWTETETITNTYTIAEECSLRIARAREGARYVRYTVATPADLLRQLQQLTPEELEPILPGVRKVVQLQEGHAALADECERLRIELNTERRANAELRGKLTAAEARVDDAEAHVAYVCATRVEAETRVKELESEVRELNERTAYHNAERAAIRNAAIEECAALLLREGWWCGAQVVLHTLKTPAVSK